MCPSTGWKRKRMRAKKAAAAALLETIESKCWQVAKSLRKERRWRWTLIDKLWQWTGLRRGRGRRADEKNFSENRHCCISLKATSKHTQRASSSTHLTQLNWRQKREVKKCGDKWLLGTAATTAATNEPKLAQTKRKKRCHEINYAHQPAEQKATELKFEIAVKQWFFLMLSFGCIKKIGQ